MKQLELDLSEPLRPGDRVLKFKGTYVAYGTVLSVFKTSLGKELVAFEFKTHPGMIHIFAPSQLRRVTEGEYFYD